jgi:UDP:flavonoid glycosyltransferase YjiC (YdhE family)
MRVLLATTANNGHFGPMVPFAGACLRAGHDVLVAAPESFAGVVERAGYRHWPCPDIGPEPWTPRPALSPNEIRSSRFTLRYRSADEAPCPHWTTLIRSPLRRRGLTPVGDLALGG